MDEAALPLPVPVAAVPSFRHSDHPEQQSEASHRSNKPINSQTYQLLGVSVVDDVAPLPVVVL